MDERGENDKDENQSEEEDEFTNFWNNKALVGDVLIKIECENIAETTIEVQIKVEKDPSDDTALNCRLPESLFYGQYFSSGVSAKPVHGLLTKIDPTKPFGSFKLSVTARRSSKAPAGNKDYSNIVN